MYDHLFHCGKKYFCRYCLHAFIAEEVLKCHIRDCFKINDKERTIIPKKVNILNSKIL